MSILLTHFEQIRVKPDMDPPLSKFAYTFTKKYRRQCFKEASRAFLLFLEKEKIEKFLESKPSQHKRKYLKKIRRLGLVLRAIYNFFDKAHKCPKDFHKFISLLGKCNDRYWLGASQKPGMRLCLAELDCKDIVINLASSKAVRKHALMVLSQIEKSLEKNKLSAHEFHVLRKNIRFCADLLQVAAAKNHGKNMHWLFASLLSLSVELGSKHDKLVLQDLRGQAEYHLSTVTIDKTFHRRFKEIEPFLKTVLGLS